MFKLTLSLQPNVTGDQLKEQIKQTIKAAREAQEEAIRDVQAERGVMVVPPVPPIGPQGTPTVGVQEARYDDRIPPEAKDISIAFFVMVAAVIIGWPIMRAIGRRIERGAPAPLSVPPEVRDQLQQIAQSVDAIAIEVERISEGQRFTTRMLTDRSTHTVMASHVTPGEQ